MRKETAEEGFQSVLRGCHKRDRALNGPVRAMSRLIAAGNHGRPMTPERQARPLGERRRHRQWRTLTCAPPASRHRCLGVAGSEFSAEKVDQEGLMTKMNIRLRSCNVLSTRRAKLADAESQAIGSI
jgi:hypothetical protein